MKNTIIVIIVILVVVIGGYFLTRDSAETTPPTTNEPTVNTPTTPTPAATTTETVTNPGQTVIGKSGEGRDIVAYHYGTGNDEILFVGGIHGGYSWNTALVAQELKKYLDSNSTVVPSNVKVTVIPVLNPDGLNKVVGTSVADFTSSDVPTDTALLTSGRFNSKNVDLNRNFDCDWQADAKWRSQSVSGGTAAFSEPEAQAIKNYVEANEPAAAIIYYSAAGGVFASSCHNGVSAETKALMNTYAQGSGYKPYDSYDFYETTGDMANWLAKIDVPAVSVLLTNHSSVEWEKNKVGIEAVLKAFAD